MGTAVSGADVTVSGAVLGAAAAAASSVAAAVAASSPRSRAISSSSCPISCSPPRLTICKHARADHIAGGTKTDQLQISELMLQAEKLPVRVQVFTCSKPGKIDIAVVTQ